MKPLLRVALIVCLAFVASGCWILPGFRMVAPTPMPAETSAPPTAASSLAASPSGCVQGTWEIQATDSQPATPDILEQTRTIIENRMNATGIVPFAVRADAPARITVTFRGSDNDSEIRKLVGETGQLLFIPVPTAFATTITEGQPIPVGMPATPIFGGDQIAAARPGTNATNQPSVDLVLKSEGAALFDAFAAQNYTGPNGGVKFAIVLDGKVASALGLNSGHFGGEVQILGNFTQAQVNALVTVLRYGSLPLQIKETGFLTASCAGIGS